MYITTWSILKSDWLYSLQPKMEKLYTVSKNKTRSWCGSDHELLIAKFRLKLKKVGKTTRPFSVIQFGHSVMPDSLRPHGLQYVRLPCPSQTPGACDEISITCGHRTGACSNSCPLSQRCHPTITSPRPLLFLFNYSKHQGLFKWVSSSHQVVKLLEFQLQHQSFQWIFRTDFL